MTIEEIYAQLTSENKQKVNAEIDRLAKKQEAEASRNPHPLDKEQAAACMKGA